MTGNFFSQIGDLFGDVFKLNGRAEDDIESGVANNDQASESFPPSTEQQSSQTGLLAAIDNGRRRATPMEPDSIDADIDDLESLYEPKFTAPPLTAPRLQVFSHPGRDGAEGSAMSLTRTLMWQLNTVFRCENKIARLLASFKEVESQQAELDTMAANIRNQLDQLADDEEPPAPKLQALEYAQEMAEELESKSNDLLRELQLTEEELLEPKADMYRDLKEVMGNYNLLENISGESDSGHVPWNRIGTQTQQHAPAAKPPTPTPSEAARYAQEDARQEARDFKTKKEIDLQNARAKVDNWINIYDDKYREYCVMVDQGATDAPKTEFDIMLFGHQQQATRDLIEAEQEYDAAVQQARGLGVVFWDEDQASQFPDNADDGYRISMEHDMVEHVDRDRIQRWMAEEEDRPNHSIDCDDWDAKTIDISDSISLVAEGKDKSRINRWQAMCDERRVEPEFLQPSPET